MSDSAVDSRIIRPGIPTSADAIRHMRVSQTECLVYNLSEHRAILSSFSLKPGKLLILIDPYNQVNILWHDTSIPEVLCDLRYWFAHRGLGISNRCRKVGRIEIEVIQICVDPGRECS